MRYQECSLVEAFLYLRSKRPCVLPNRGLFHQSSRNFSIEDPALWIRLSSLSFEHAPEKEDLEEVVRVLNLVGVASSAVLPALVRTIHLPMDFPDS